MVRIKEPRKKLNPIRGQAPPPVAERPKCRSCGKPLRPNMHEVWETVELGEVPVYEYGVNGRYVQTGTRPGTITRQVGVREWDGTYGDGHGFCGLYCQAAFGRVAAKILTRIPKHCGTCGARIAWEVDR